VKTLVGAKTGQGDMAAWWRKPGTKEVVDNPDFCLV